MNRHLCCMRADCSDTDFEGRQVARLHQADGGMRCRTDFSELLDPPAATPSSAANHTRIALICIAGLAVACAVAAALGFPLSLPF